MKVVRRDFYDPLYDFVTFEEAAHAEPRDIFRHGFTRKGVATHGESISPHNDAKAVLPFLDTPELARLSFLRQSDLAFLVYPSASHTRFAHAIGSCYLGFVASQRVAVNRGMSFEANLAAEYLSSFLESTGLREEFYLALLLHDTGHFPFSHALENNRDFWEAFGQELCHEDTACQLIEGSGDFCVAFQKRHRPTSEETRKDRPPSRSFSTDLNL